MFEAEQDVGAGTSDPTRRPLVTVVLPMLDEVATIKACLDRFGSQSYGTDNLDVVVVDGGSTDGSRELVERYASEHPWCRVVDNPKKKAAAAFNVGVREARGSVLVLFSSHGEPLPDFVEESVNVLLDTGAAGVGGRYHHLGVDPVSSAVGLAMVSPVGMASSHRTVTTRREVDTISHPAYDIEVMRAVGPFDETLERNSDYEFNYRVRRAGHQLVVDPAIESIYRPRPSLSALARQFWWYGRWKERTVRRHPGSIRPRHLVAPGAVAAFATSPVWARHPVGRRLFVVGAAAYAAVVLVGVVGARPRQHGADPAVLAACFPVMHGAWGAGFLTSLMQDALIGEPK